MARPKLDGLTYFSHDCNAHLDEDKMIPLVVRHGIEGSGHYWFLLEVIYTQKNGELHLDDIVLDRLTAQMRLTREKFFEILTTEFKLGLFISKTHKELFNNSGKLIDNSWKLIENSEKTPLLTSSGIKKRRNIVMHKRLIDRDKKVSGGFSPGKTHQKHDRNTGKDERRKRESIKDKEGEGAPKTVEKIAFEKAETAWKLFEPLVRVASDTITIKDDLSRQVFFELGGLDDVKKLIEQNGTVLKSVFCSKYADLEIKKYQEKSA